MPKLLLAVDGSESAIRATRSLIEAAGRYTERPEVELLTVHPAVPPLDVLSSAVVSRDMIERYYREEGEKVFAPIRELLGTAGLKYTAHVLVGDIASTIVEHASNSAAR